MKILIIKLSSLGDIVHALPVATVLKRYFPGYQLDWLVNERFKELLVGHRTISRVYSWCADWIQNHETLWTLRHNQYDCVLDLQGLMKTGLISHCVNSGASVTLSPTREPLAQFFHARKIPSSPVLDPQRHVISRNLDILKVFNIDPDTLKITAPEAFCLREETDKYIAQLEGKPYIILAPETNWKSKEWPYWQELIDLTRSTHPEHTIILLGQHRSPVYKHVLDLRGETDLPDLKALTSGARLVIGSDSGIIHIASANAPVIGLYGATSPERTGAWQAINLSQRVSCSPCHKRDCPLTADSEKHRCMRELEAGSVLLEITEILKSF